MPVTLSLQYHCDAATRRSSQMFPASQCEEPSNQEALLCFLSSNASSPTSPTSPTSFMSLSGRRPRPEGPAGEAAHAKLATNEQFLWEAFQKAQAQFQQVGGLK